MGGIKYVIYPSTAFRFPYHVSTTFQRFLLSASFQSFLSKSLYKSTGVAPPSLRYRLNTMFYLSNFHTINLTLIYPLWLDYQKIQKQSRNSSSLIFNPKGNYKFLSKFYPGQGIKVSYWLLLFSLLTCYVDQLWIYSIFKFFRTVSHTDTG